MLLETVLRTIGANAQLLGECGNEVAADIGRGHAAIGLSIDFPVQSAIARGAPMRFPYPGATASPAHVAILRQAPHPENAAAFVSFVLSSGGQKLLFDPAIRRLPARPSAYASKPEGYVDPFSLKTARIFCAVRNAR
jgi:ABC-type Fe3+ transport system substrate-binding protein